MELFEVVMAGLIQKNGKFLIIQRSPDKKRFPSKWTIPGGKLETTDYTSLPKDTEDYWYNVLEKTLAREIQEEVNLEVKNIRYITSLATVHDDGNPSLVISCLADYSHGDIQLQPEECVDFKWVSAKEAERYDLIDGILDEIYMADAVLKGGRADNWKRKS